MSQRLLLALLVVQSLLLTLLAADRLVPVARADGPMTCEISNWPPMLTGSGFSALRVEVESVKGMVPVEVREVDPSVNVVMRGWSTSDRVSVQAP